MHSFFTKTIRLCLTLTPLYIFNPLCLHAHSDNDMVLIPSGKLIVNTKHGNIELFIENFFMDRFEVTQKSFKINMGNLSGKPILYTI